MWRDVVSSLIVQQVVGAACRSVWRYWRLRLIAERAEPEHTWVQTSAGGSTPWVEAPWATRAMERLPRALHFVISREIYIMCFQVYVLTLSFILPPSFFFDLIASLLEFLPQPS